MYLDSVPSLIQIVFRSSVVYLSIIFAFRIAGKRHISQLSLADFALILLVSNAVQNAMVGNDTSLLGGLAAAGTLILINVLLTKLVFRDSTLSKVFQGEPRLIVRNGSVLEQNMAKEDITLNELEESIREHGFESISDIRTAILELDGSISVIPYDKEGHNHERSVRPIVRKQRGRRGWFKN